MAAVRIWLGRKALGNGTVNLILSGVVMVMRWVIWFVGAWCLAVGSAAFAGSAEAEAALRERAKAYWDARKSNDLQTIYLMEAATAKGRLRPDEVSKTQMSTLRLVGYSFTEVKITGDKGEIKIDTEVMHPAIEGKPLMGPSFVDYWTLIDQKWYHTAKTKPGKKEGSASPSP
ncbi:MAG: hypothetical protein AB1648_00505 [Pseudomonadota bacterium]